MLVQPFSGFPVGQSELFPIRNVGPKVSDVLSFIRVPTGPHFHFLPPSKGSFFPPAKPLYEQVTSRQYPPPMNAYPSGQELRDDSLIHFFA